MSSELLHCTICPKKPRFSDASHLLTHVSSKGHLSSLHKLQVRSHQEVDAGHELALYNHWYHEHDVARLLSQRLLDKEAKQADKRAANRRRALGPKGGKPMSKVTESIETPISVSAYSAEASILQMRRAEKTRYDISDSDSDFTPLRRSKRIAIYASSPLKQGPLIPDDDGTMLTHAAVKASVNPQLKGTVWPGMHMFDAAPDDMKRKRNQRKDGSVLVRMEKTAAMVEPTETVHSATGEILTQRHIDELETASPVPGEPSVLDMTPKPRRTKAGRHSGSEKRFGRARRVRKVHKSPLARKSRGRSNLHDTQAPIPRYAPTEDENMEFKLTFGNIGNRRLTSPLHIYQDLSSSSFGGDGSAEVHNPFFSQPLATAVSSQGHLAYLPTAYAPEVPAADPYRALRERLAVSDLRGFLHDKENIAPSHQTMLHGYSSQVLNPSMLHHHTGVASAEQFLESTSIGEASRSIFPHYDPFITPSRFPNPLMPILNSARRRKLPKPYTPPKSTDQALGAQAPFFE